MNRIDRYISGLFWSFFVGGLLIFVTIFIAVDSMTNILQYPGVGTQALLAYYGYSIPDIVYKLIPVACLMATIFAISSLQKANELVALFSSGMSLVRITASIMLWVFVISIFSFFAGDQTLSKFAQKKNYVFYNDIKKNPALYSTTKNNRIWYRSKDTIFNMKTLNTQSHTAQGLTLYYFSDKWELMQMMTADEVSLEGENWVLKNGSVTIFTEDSSFPMTSQFKEKTIVMGEGAKDIGSTAHTSDVLSLAELKAFIKKNKEAGLDTLRYEVDYYSKFGYGFAAIVMVLLGIPFSVGRTRGGGIMLNMGMCLGLVFLYWVFYSSALTLGHNGRLHPVLAAWLPNFVCIVIAIYFIRKMKK